MQSKKGERKIDSMGWCKPDMCWTDAMKRMLPDAKAASMLMENDYATHGQKEAHIENPNGSGRLPLRCDRQKYVKDPIPYLK